MLLKSKKLPIGMGFQVRDDKSVLKFPIYWTGVERGWYDRGKHGPPVRGRGSWPSGSNGLWYFVVSKNLLIFGDDQ